MGGFGSNQSLMWSVRRILPPTHTHDRTVPPFTTCLHTCLADTGRRHPHYHPTAATHRACRTALRRARLPRTRTMRCRMGSFVLPGWRIQPARTRTPTATPLRCQVFTNTPPPPPPTAPVPPAATHHYTEPLLTYRCCRALPYACITRTTATRTAIPPQPGRIVGR